jgi:hypothetical protein
MSGLNETHFADFESLLALWDKAYPCVSVSYVGLKTAQGPRLLIGRVILEPTQEGLTQTTFRFETEHVIASQFVADVTPVDTKEVLKEARKGRISVGGKDAALLLHGEGELSAHFSAIHHPLVQAALRLPTLRIAGAHKHALMTSVADPLVLDWELKAGDTPFDSLDELLSSCKLPTLQQMGDSTSLEIVAKTPAMIGATSKISNGEAVIECRLAAALDIENLRLGYRVFHKESVERGSIKGHQLDWRQEAGIAIGAYRLAVSDARLLQAFLSYEGVCHHQWWVTDPQKQLNPRHAVHLVFDENLELLRALLLRPDTDKAYAFEGAVSTLLSLLGFSVCNYGRIPKLQQGPDIIAITPSGHIGVVECTVGLLDANDKLAKLVQRAKLIREKLDSSGYGFLQSLAMIVTPLSRGEVVAHLEIAGKHGIAVACKEDIEGMLTQVNLFPNADRSYEDAKRLIPSSGQVALFQ